MGPLEVASDAACLIAASPWSGWLAFDELTPISLHLRHISRCYPFFAFVSAVASPDLAANATLSAGGSGDVTVSSARPVPGGNSASRPSYGWPRVRAKRLMLVSLAAVGVTLAVTTSTLLVYLYNRATAQSWQQLQSLSLVLADQAERAFDAVELVQTALIERLQSAGVRTQADFRAHLVGLDAFEDLRGRIRSLPQMDAITTIDAEGNLLNFSRFWPTPTINVADRDYFKALSKAGGSSVFIGQPVPNRGTGTWTIYVAKRVSGPDGAFLGLVLGAVELAYFERLYQSVIPDADSSISLFRQDGAQLARYPHIETNIGKSFATNAMFTAFSATGAASVAVRLRSRSTGDDRLMAAHRLAHYPLLVSASTSIESVLSSWRKEAAAMISGTVALEFLLAAAAWLMVRELKSQSRLDEAKMATARAETARRDSEAALLLAQERARADREMTTQHRRFEVALNNMSQGLCMFDENDLLIVANERLAEMFGLPLMQVQPSVSLTSLLAWSAALGGLGQSDADTILYSLGVMKNDAVQRAATFELADGRAMAVNFEPTSVDQPTESTALAARLIEALSAPYELMGHQMVIGTSVGISVAPGDGDSPDALLKNADMALYRAKADGRGRYRFFESEMDAMMQARRILELDLRKALIAGEFTLFYQPLMTVKTRQFGSRRLVQNVAQALQQSGLPPHRLELEITETGYLFSRPRPASEIAAIYLSLNEPWVEAEMGEVSSSLDERDIVEAEDFLHQVGFAERLEEL
eukprot:gene13336-13451_t